MAHGDTVIDGDGVEFLGDTTHAFDLSGDHLAKILEMDVTWDELGEGIGDGDDRLAEIRILHARRAPETTGAGHVAAVGGCAGTIFSQVDLQKPYIRSAVGSFREIPYRAHGNADQPFCYRRKHTATAPWCKSSGSGAAM